MCLYRIENDVCSIKTDTLRVQNITGATETVCCECVLETSGIRVGTVQSRIPLTDIQH